MKNIAIIGCLFLLVLSSCSSDDSSKQKSENRLTEITTLGTENDGTERLYSKTNFFYNSKNQIEKTKFLTDDFALEMNYLYNEKNQVTKLTMNMDDTDYPIEILYDESSMIPTKIKVLNASNLETEILNIDNNLFWTKGNTSFTLDNISVNDFSFTQFTRNQDVIKYSFFEDFKNGLEHNNSNFSMVTYIVLSFTLSNTEMLSIYGFDCFDKPINQIVLSNNQVVTYVYDIIGKKVNSRKMTLNNSSEYLTQKYTYQ